MAFAALGPATGAAALVPARFWRVAGRQRRRRISRREALDAAGLNRMVTARNRAQIPNARAALATAVAAGLAALRIALGWVGAGGDGQITTRSRWVSAVPSASAAKRTRPPAAEPSPS